MNIYVVSRSRANLVGKNQSTINFIPKNQEVTYVIPTDQNAKYVNSLSWFENVNIMTMDYDGIAHKRQLIAEHVRNQSGETFMVIDDDVKFFQRKSEEDWHLEDIDKDEWQKMMNLIENLLTEGGYSHIGVSMREGNNRFGVVPRGHVEDSVRTCRALAYRVDDFLSVEHQRVKIMEDFDVNLQLLKSGKKIGNLIYYCQNQFGGTGLKGGCSDYRDLEMQAEAAQALADLHPGIVEVVDKKNKSSGEMSVRKDVKIQWKKAAQEGSK